MRPYRCPGYRRFEDVPPLHDPTDCAGSNADDIERNEHASADHKSTLEIVVNVHHSPLEIDTWDEESEQEDKQDQCHHNGNGNRAHFAVCFAPIAVPSPRVKNLSPAPRTCGVCRPGRIRVVTIATPMMPISTFSTVLNLASFLEPCG